MKPAFHKKILLQSLGRFFSDLALKQIVRANLNQDSVFYSVGYDHFHYDNNSFQASSNFINSQRDVVIKAIRLKQDLVARNAFGRLTHTAQDFYAHTNYVSLWLTQNDSSSPDDIEALDKNVLSHPRLCSGRIYLRELLTWTPLVGHYFMQMMPLDSHARMNIDDPSRPHFDYVIVASKKRTMIEYEIIAEQLTSADLKYFTGNYST